MDEINDYCCALTLIIGEVVGSAIRWEKIENFQAKDVLQLFAHFEQKNWSFLLDSCSFVLVNGDNAEADANGRD